MSELHESNREWAEESRLAGLKEQSEDTEPVYEPRETGKTLDGEPIELWIDPESEHQFQVSLSSFGYDSITWATETEQQARDLFEALQHAKLVDMD